MQRRFRGTDRFIIEAEIGRGGSGIVYRAYDRELDAEVALKTLTSLAPESVAELKREFRSLLGISHRNLVQLHELVVTEDVAFFTMELIHGRDIVTAVRDHGGASTGAILNAYQRDRLSELALQIIDAIEFVHTHGRVHRDIKPSNILVDADDRVVVLDFGMAQASRPISRFAQPDGGIAGTLAYMAPELFSGGSPSPASDWYAVGAVLHHALVGAPAQIHANAATNEPYSDPLYAAVRRALEEEPETRASAGELRAALSTVGRATGDCAIGGVFVGREAELAALHTALRGAVQRTPIVVRVHGPSGIGKSSLIQQFARSAEQDGCLVFNSRCHHQESVPFKGFDGLLDQVAEFLDRLSVDQRLSYLPRRFTDVAQVFPAFAHLAWRSSSLQPAAAVDPIEMRRRAFNGLRELLLRIGARNRLVLWIDDLQWADADSGVLLRELLRPPDPPSLLLVLSYRSDEASAAEVHVPTADSGLDIRDMAVGPLDARDSRILLRRVLEDDTLSNQDLDHVVAEANGVPLFLDQVARHDRARSHGTRYSALATLDEVLSERLADIADDARVLVETASVAGQALDRDLLFTAAGAGASARPISNALEAKALLRSTTAGAKQAIEVYHDKIREVVLATLSPERVRGIHFELARSAEISVRPDAGFLHRHYKGAGMLDVAGEWALRSAQHAEESLAFLEAARMFGEAEELLPPQRAREIGLDERRATALVNAGHCSTAAPIFANAARSRAVDDGRRLRRLAAEQYLVSGHIDDGLRELEALCREIDVPFPRNDTSALLRMFGKILQLRLHGIRFTERAAESIPIRELMAVDLCDSAGKGLVVVDPMRGLYFSILSLFLALRAGDARRIARGLCMGGAALSPLPLTAPWGRTMIERVRDLGHRRGDPYFAGLAELALGQCLVIERDWVGVLDACDRGAQILEEGSRGTTWERNVGRMAALRALEELGRLPEFKQRAHQLLVQAEDQGDRYSQVVARQNLAAVRLAAGDLDGSARDMEKAIELWGQEGFHVQHFYALRLEATRRVYQDDPLSASQLVNAKWNEIRRANLLRHPTLRADAHLMRARVAIAAIAAAPRRAAPLTRELKRDLDALTRDARSDLVAFLTLLRAGMAGKLPAAPLPGSERSTSLLSDKILVIRQLQRAANEPLLAARIAELRALGITDPPRWIQAMSPGLPTLSSIGCAGSTAVTSTQSNAP